MSQDASSISFPRLETNRLWLRQATLADVQAIFAIFSDPEVTRFHNLDTFTSLDEAVAVIERRANGFKNGHGIRWGIAQKTNNVLIGSCGFTWDKNVAEVGYELASPFWRQGIMSEALSTILNYGFKSRGLQSVFAEIILENIASKRLLNKLGFQSQEILKEHFFGRENFMIWSGFC